MRRGELRWDRAREELEAVLVDLGIPRYPLRALRSLPAAVPNLQETPFSTLPGVGHPRRRR